MLIKAPVGNISIASNKKLQRAFIILSRRVLNAIERKPFPTGEVYDKIARHIRRAPIAVFLERKTTYTPASVNKTILKSHR